MDTLDGLIRRIQRQDSLGLCTGPVPRDSRYSQAYYPQSQPYASDTAQEGVSVTFHVSQDPHTGESLYHIVESP
ncbi:hypothetical protein EXS74_00680 [Candidatus Woesearchaeota archaeon]|nr:hypothetical protein [Candidatus Woesearchaeota archaeon]